MLKISSVDPTDFSDESGRKIYISTGPRKFFRERFPEDFSETTNDELNRIIAEDVSKSGNVKTFVPGSASTAQKTRELGVIKKSSNFGIYYICILGDSGARVISVKESIKEGAPPQEFGSRVETGITDPKRGKPIRVNTTVRKIFRDDYKKLAFPPDPIKTFENAGILELSKYIATLYSSGGDKTIHVWRNPSRSENLMEIRAFGRNQYFITILGDQYCDIISVQGQWLSDKMKKYRETSVKKEFSPSREGKGERARGGDYLR
jgi:hypothetical protein